MHRSKTVGPGRYDSHITHIAILQHVPVRGRQRADAIPLQLSPFIGTSLITSFISAFSPPVAYYTVIFNFSFCKLKFQLLIFRKRNACLLENLCSIENSDKV